MHACLYIVSPTLQPSEAPTTLSPTFLPTLAPTQTPTFTPTAAPSFAYALSNLTGYASFIPQYAGLCTPLEVHLHLEMTQAILLYGVIRLHTYGLTSGPCSSPVSGSTGNTPLLLFNQSEFSALYVEGNYSYGFQDSYIELEVRLPDGLVPNQHYHVVIDRSNGLQRSCSANYTEWGVSIGYCHKSGRCLDYSDVASLPVISPFEAVSPVSQCFAYNSSMFISPAMPHLAATVSVAFSFAFQITAGYSIIVSLPGFTNRLRASNLTDLEVFADTHLSIPGTKTGYNLFMHNQSTMYSNGIAWNTPYSWSAEWVEGDPGDYYLTSRVILSPIIPYYDLPLLSSNISSAWISIDAQPNGLSSVYGRYGNYSGFTYEVLPPAIEAGYYSVPETPFAYSTPIGTGCDSFNQCNGQGACDPTLSLCMCFLGFGSAVDLEVAVSDDFAPDCSSLACPVGRATYFAYPTDLMDTNGTTPTTRPFVECSNRGQCGRKLGKCRCNEGYEGAACERGVCNSETCSDHGRCLTRKQLMIYAQTTPYNLYSYLNTYPWNNVTFYGGFDGSSTCVCDSSWAVGYGPDQTQEPEYFGASCELRHCPTGDNPSTVVDETNCTGVALFTGGPVGLTGNKCQVDCSNQGVCDYNTGVCKCYQGYWGVNCGILVSGVDAASSYTGTSGV